ncbi:hypothetical protein DDB_G0287357 [Dictyostelium discoideum AX4]|uniref:Peptidase S53 domain-containing protein n=1 Tax=Dictyostelium discoideum TaxID=44689 RepID=Q54KG5_DICDI|nr:hypothetical protein DDB_G0287357 [Dictyostelium discoideum AX4]EAL63746.1 hypothetical protein DDB_G0287357 [Dictyostelium discoideum AX4]|eukprot:XP_637258.1 hypothetical protein DDB_G0287357 [Dictyostelium discoideum AX4]
MILKLIILLVIILFANAKENSGDGLKRETIANIRNPPSYFNFKSLPNENEIIEFKILIKQNNLNILKEKFWDISNPKSLNYGKFLSSKEIDSIISPSKKDVEIILNWLFDNKINKSEMIVFSDYIKIRINILKASNLFKTNFGIYKSEISNKERIRIIGDASIPINVLNKIDLVLGLSDFIEDNKMSETMRKSRDDIVGISKQLSISPQVLKDYYGIPNDTIGTNSKNVQSIGAFSDYYSTGALETFDQQFSIENVRVLNAGSPLCYEQGCGQLESDLDVQYMTAIGNNITTMFLESGSGEWVLDWCTSIQAFDPIPNVASISYGWIEMEQCEITQDCNNLGVDSTVYIERTNVEFQKIGLRGTSIFVSSGDDGSPGFFDVFGNCPVDGINGYCPFGGCEHTTTNCATITIVNSNFTESPNCFYPVNQMGIACRELIIVPEVIDALGTFQQVNAHCDFQYEFDVFGYTHIYSSCLCEDLTPVSGEGFKMVGYSFDPSNGPVFNPEFPASSPYVTSVGATEIYESPQPESVCSIQSGSIITSGGGFSVTQSQPQYQTNAVNRYLEQQPSSLPPSFSFNSSNRAYPDISLAGSKYSIVQSNNVSSNLCPCITISVDGTSCSSPSIAAMFSLINDKLLNSGKSTLGFLNPLLYQAAEESPNVFNDIINGNNNCNRMYCCEFGYKAITGFDPASGLGSIVYSNMENYILSQK